MLFLRPSVQEIPIEPTVPCVRGCARPADRVACSLDPVLKSLRLDEKVRQTKLTKQKQEASTTWSTIRKGSERSEGESFILV